MNTTPPADNIDLTQAIVASPDNAAPLLSFIYEPKQMADRLASDENGQGYWKLAGQCKRLLWLIYLVPAVLALCITGQTQSFVDRWLWFLIPVFALLVWGIDMRLHKTRKLWLILLFTLVSAVLHLALLCAAAKTILWVSANLFMILALSWSFLTCLTAVIGLSHAVALSAALTRNFRGRAHFVRGVLLTSLPLACGVELALAALVLFFMMVFVFASAWQADGYVNLIVPLVVGILVPVLILYPVVLIYTGLVILCGIPGQWGHAHRVIRWTLPLLLVIIPALSLAASGLWALLSPR